MSQTPQPCTRCEQPGYEQVREGWLCREHFIKWLEQVLGRAVIYSGLYAKATAGEWKPTPLFEGILSAGGNPPLPQEMEQIS